MVRSVDAGALREVMHRYLEALRAHREEINSLNVFPVPDGDTGTNMLLTQQAVEEALGVAEAGGLAVVGEAISRAALAGARGNSGVILSQVLRGLCARMCREASAGPADLAEGLMEAAEEARRAVAEPLEGTMLTVLRDAAEAAGVAARAEGGCDDVAQAALAAALASLDRTRDRLPALTEAGVVDAGAKGVVLLFDALVSVLRGEPLSVAVGPRGPVGEASAGAATASEYGYEVMYLLDADDHVLPGLRERLGAIGDSLVVVGGSGLYNVHVHTDDAGRAVEEGVGAGRPRGIRITSLDAQVEACMAGEARGVRVGEPVSGRCATAVIAVASEPGIAALFASLGATTIPGPEPSDRELSDAIRRSGGDGVLILPNHPDAVQAAERAVEDAGVPAAVAEARSVPEGLAAALAALADEPLEDNAKHAAEAIERVTALEADGDAVVACVQGAYRDRHEAVTLIAGSGVMDQDAELLVSRIAKEIGAGLDVQWHRGGQESPDYLIGLE